MRFRPWWIVLLAIPGYFILYILIQTIGRWLFGDVVVNRTLGGHRKGVLGKETASEIGRITLWILGIGFIVFLFIIVMVLTGGS